MQFEGLLSDAKPCGAPIYGCLAGVLVTAIAVRCRMGRTELTAQRARRERGGQRRSGTMPPCVCDLAVWDDERPTNDLDAPDDVSAQPPNPHE